MITLKQTTKLMALVFALIVASCGTDEQVNPSISNSYATMAGMSGSVAGRSGAMAGSGGAVAGSSSVVAGSSGAMAGSDSLVVAGSSGALPDGPEVTVTQGKVRGALSKGTRAFLGIPYGAPPVGAKRWTPPSPAAAWPTTLDATQFGAACPQMNTAGTAYDTTSKEDCLFLNVWAPETAPAQPIPVMVWFHGGAFVFGSGGTTASHAYDGEELVKAGNVVVVTVNYRLASIGFLAHPALTAEAKAASTAPTNFGILDQRLALQWVQDNIAAFGGDKNNVTVFGESAGGVSVAIHLISEASQPLFHRGIIESGMCLMQTTTLAQAEAIGQRYATGVGCTNAADALTCLRNLPVEQVITGPADKVTTPGGVFFQDASKNYTFGPSVDGTVLPEQIEAAFAAKRISKVPVLQGANTSEGILFHAGVFGDVKPANQTEYKAALTTRFGAKADAIIKKYPDYQTDLPKISALVFFRCPALRTANYLAAAGVNNYLYSFDLPLDSPVPALKDQAFHSSEIPYVFNTDAFSLGKIPATNAGYVKQIMGYWTSFATTGEPNGNAPVVKWPTYTAANPAHINLAKPTSIKSDWDADCEFWADLFSTP
jgi:para-nitrobenzyl esterase